MLFGHLAVLPREIHDSELRPLYSTHHSPVQGGAMDDQRPEDAAKLAAFPRQSAMPCVCVADGRQQMRTFLAETLEDLGCVTCECVHVAELNAELGTRPPDLVVIGSSAGGIEACEMVELLAAKEFGGKVLVLGRELRRWWRRSRNSVRSSALKCYPCSRPPSAKGICAA